MTAPKAPEMQIVAAIREKRWTMGRIMKSLHVDKMRILDIADRHGLMERLIANRYDVPHNGGVFRANFKRRRQLLRLWNSGVKTKLIAEKMGYKNVISVHSTVRRLRVTEDLPFAARNSRRKKT